MLELFWNINKVALTMITLMQQSDVCLGALNSEFNLLEQPIIPYNIIMQHAMVVKKSRAIARRSQGKQRKRRACGPVFATSVNCMLKDEEQTKQGSRIRIVARKTINYFQKVFRSISDDHIYNFLGQICINEETLKNQDHDESILRTIFHIRTIQQVEIGADSVSLFLRSNNINSHIPYLVERFNSFGDSYFHNIAIHIHTLHQFFTLPRISQIMQRPEPTHQEATQKSRQLQQILEGLKGKPYLLKYLPNQFIFSKALLELMGREMEDFGRECSQYRVMLEDVFTSDNYRFLLERGFIFLGILQQVMRGELTMADLLLRSAHIYTDTIRGPNETRIKVRIKGYMPNRHCVVMLVDEILGIQSSLGPQLPKSRQQEGFLENFLMENATTIRQITRLETKYHEKSDNRCSYQMKAPPRKKIPDLDYCS